MVVYPLAGIAPDLVLLSLGSRDQRVNQTSGWNYLADWPTLVASLLWLGTGGVIAKKHKARYAGHKTTTTDSTGKADVMGHNIQPSDPTRKRAVARAIQHIPTADWVRYGGFAVVTITAIWLSGCAQQVTRHGQLFQDNDLQQIAPGMTQEQVKLTLGTPNTTAAAGTGNAYYYISSTMVQSAFMLPNETDRKVVAIYFTQGGTVERVANYGMKDGKVFDAIKRTTPSANTNDDGVIKSLFRNLGQKSTIFSGE
jgi:outer membrane protein assembly factor BamE (lipoprotein component of BamABCDE complex)